MHVLVTDADNRAALAITRSLGRAGHRVAVGHHVHPTLASSSRYCMERLILPDVQRDPDAFVDAISRATNAQQFGAIVPVSDITTLTIARAAVDGPIADRLCTPAVDQLELAADKLSSLELARHLGIPVPRTVVVSSTAQPIQTINIPFPLVLKPSRSRVWDGKEWSFNSVSYTESPEHLGKILATLAPAQFPLLLQERIEGPGVGVFACYDRGRPVALFSHRRIREKPPSGGVSVLREAVPVDPQAATYACSILEALNWHGVAMVEFKMDRRDGTLKFMEINGRYWGSLQLAIDAGVDFPRIALQIIAGQPVEPVRSYEIGVRSRWLWGDIDALLALFLQPRNQLHLPSDHPGRWLTLARFLIPWHPGLHYEILALSDPNPWIFETRKWIAHALNRT